MNELINHFQRWKHPRILIVGDVMLDRYTWGDVERICPEAPVPVLRSTAEEVRLGGAGSVAMLLKALEVQVELVAMVGDDAGGRTVRRLLVDLGISTELLLVDESRPTTEKWRLLGKSEGKQPHYLLRVDREDSHLVQSDQEELLIERASRALPSCGAVLISDYAKGVATQGLLRIVIDSAKRIGLPVLVDPGRCRSLEMYRGADCVLPNRLEAAFLAGHPIEGPEDALAVARTFCEQHSLGAVLLKLDRDGMVLVDHKRESEAVIPAASCQVQDVTGAGDMVLAATGLGLSSGLTLRESAELSNIAAALQIQQLGVVPVSRAEILAAVCRPLSWPKVISLAQLAEKVAQYRLDGKRIVFTNGCFDLLHVGHVTYLQEAARLGDVLVVAINADATVKRLKGKDRPIIDQQDRAGMLAALGCVSHVTIFDEETPHELLRRLRPDVLVKGGTYLPHEVVGREIVDQYGGQVHVVGLVPNTSTTTLIQRIGNSLSPDLGPSELAAR